MNNQQRELAREINNLYWEAERICNSAGCSRQLDESFEAAKRGERDHRAFGRRLNQPLRGRALVDVCAQLFVLSGFVTPKRKRSFEARNDFVLAYGAASAAARIEPTRYRAQ